MSKKPKRFLKVIKTRELDDGWLESLIGMMIGGFISGFILDIILDKKIGYVFMLQLSYLILWGIVALMYKWITREEYYEEVI